MTPTPSDHGEPIRDQTMTNPLEQWLALLQDTEAGLDVEAGLREILPARDSATVHTGRRGT